MALIAPFKALRPKPEFASQVASPPYDVLNSAEAKQAAAGNPYSFLHVTKSEIDLPPDVHAYSKIVYEKAGENIRSLIQQGVLERESKPCYYLYRLIMQGRSQTGLVSVSSVDDYLNGVIKKHEFTRPDKEQDRINHISISGAQTGNVFLAYNNVAAMDELVEKRMKEDRPFFDFTATDGIQHTIWRIEDDATIERITGIFKEKVPFTYIADGHHRAASAAKVRSALGERCRTRSGLFSDNLIPGQSVGDHGL